MLNGGLVIEMVSNSMVRMLLIFGTDLSKLGAYSKSVRKNALLEVLGK